MILICDKTVSERAISMRERIFGLGYPCAVTEIGKMRERMPACVLFCFADTLSFVRKTPYDNIPIICTGEGFVNSALNAVKIDRGDGFRESLRELVIKHSGIVLDKNFPFGGFVRDIFLSECFFEIQGNAVYPTDTEYRILKYLLFSSSAKNPASAEAVHAYVRKSYSSAETNSAAVMHISKLNRRCEEACGKRPIISVRSRGYYLDTTL